ncbi:TIGR02117 family protein [Rhizobiaceae bacterium BDR2-2]|uniref:TIGR02117 family protein n=1 Tax=Ectorhizobium quercum TaxID=2965071 RepID=A0AAE3MYI2_9HYPH|nr:TIGR02117 family protein [Ectorhizobium quercum]MCX8996687.1 TIGR02117 family protein [Ectorhizobium quercum]
MKKVAGLSAVAIGLVFLSVVAGMLVPRPLFTPSHAAAEGAFHRILVISNPIHTDIAIPLDTETRRQFSFLEGAGLPIEDGQAEWLVFGWGGRAFYVETPTWADLKPLPVLRALTLDRSVMHVDVAGHIPDTHPAVSSFDLDGAGYRRLLAFIAGSFAGAPDRVVPAADSGYSERDRFFEARGYFNALFGCNTWTAKALRTGGLRTGIWNPAPQTLVLSLNLFN